ncbi:MAG: glycosyltransferase family 4 protein [Nitrososphaeria archaeon]
MSLMRIGFVCSEYFGAKETDVGLIPTSVHGGFGFLTRLKAEYLASLGNQVDVFTYAYSFDYEGKSPSEISINDVKIHLIPEKVIVGKNNLLLGAKYMVSKPKENKYFLNLITKEQIQILQFEDTPTSMIMADLDNLKKILIFQDPFDYYDNNLLIDSKNNYLNIFKGETEPYHVKKINERFPNELLINWLHRRNFINPIKKILNDSNSLSIFAEADFIGEKVKKLFDLKYVPKTLRNPIFISNSVQKKSQRPSFTWVGRWDPQKRPDTMLRVAKELPEYDFYLIGTATRVPKDFLSIESKLIKEYSKYRNIHILGFVDEKTKREFIGKSWALVNTSIREGLPITFLEAMAEGTPIISYVDPDNYVTRFGIKTDYNIDSFKEAIEESVSEKLYEKKGEEEREYIRKEHEIGVVMNRHIDIYENILGEL